MPHGGWNYGSDHKGCTQNTMCTGDPEAKGHEMMVCVMVSPPTEEVW